MIRFERHPHGMPDWMRVSPFPSRLFIPPGHGAEQVQLAVLWLMVFFSAIVVLDILYNVMSIVAIGLFTLLGLRLDRRNVPLMMFLVLFNVAGLIALQPYLDVQESREFMVGTCFVAVTAVFLAMVINENALQRLEAIKWGLIAGGLLASGTAILGISAGAAETGDGHDGPAAGQFSMYGGRASGTFRDPNVLGSFLVVPALYLTSDILRTAYLRLVRIALLAPIVLALFLTYSRGSWAAFVIGTGVLAFLTFVTSRSDAGRARVMLLSLFGIVGLALALLILLSIDSIREVFLDRFTLQKDYDSGPSGRFGNQLRSIPHLLELPFGYGPNRFWLFFRENPHNSYINAFASYGWLGGITYLAFIITTVVISWRTAFTRSPFQIHAIVLFATLIPHLIQNFQIDTDRWRHLFMIYGLCWGIAAITARWREEYRAYAHLAYRQQQMSGASPVPAE